MRISTGRPLTPPCAFHALKNKFAPSYSGKYVDFVIELASVIHPILIGVPVACLALRGVFTSVIFFVTVTVLSNFFVTATSVICEVMTLVFGLVLVELTVRVVLVLSPKGFATFLVFVDTFAVLFTE